MQEAVQELPLDRAAPRAIGQSVARRLAPPAAQAPRHDRAGRDRGVLPRRAARARSSRRTTIATRTSTTRWRRPSWHHPFGTDRLGRDQLSRVIWSARTTIIITRRDGAHRQPRALGRPGHAVRLRGGKVDTAIMRTGEVFASLPALPMLILISATMRPKAVDGVDWLESHIGTRRAPRRLPSSTPGRSSSS